MFIPTQANNHRVIFFGTPKIAQHCLQALLDKHINVVAVVTKPDALVGRKQILTQCEVKVLAQKHNIPVIQPEKLSLVINQIKDLQPDLIITCAYGKILPEAILNIPKYHCVNIHTSLLPR
jgi:methionyl-tRNA formyltransferase